MGSAAGVGNAAGAAFGGGSGGGGTAKNNAMFSTAGPSFANPPSSGVPAPSITGDRPDFISITGDRPDFIGPVGDQKQGAEAYRRYQQGPGSQGQLNFDYGAPGQGGRPIMSDANGPGGIYSRYPNGGGPDFGGGRMNNGTWDQRRFDPSSVAPGFGMYHPQAPVMDMVNKIQNGTFNPGDYAHPNGGGMVGNNGQPLGNGPMLGQGGDPYWSQQAVRERGGNTGVYGGPMGGGITRGDMINGGQRIGNVGSGMYGSNSLLPSNGQNLIQQYLNSPQYNPQPGQMIPNGWGGYRKYDPNFTGIS